MTIDKHTIANVELLPEEEAAIVIVRHLLDNVEDFLFRDRDIIENADTGEVIERSTLYSTRNLLEVLYNDRCPTRWEYPN